MVGIVENQEVMDVTWIRVRLDVRGRRWRGRSHGGEPGGGTPGVAVEDDDVGDREGDDIQGDDDLERLRRTSWTTRSSSSNVQDDVCDVRTFRTSSWTPRGRPRGLQALLKHSQK